MLRGRGSGHCSETSQLYPVGKWGWTRSVQAQLPLLGTSRLCHTTDIYLSLARGEGVSRAGEGCLIVMPKSFYGWCGKEGIWEIAV